MVLASLLTRLVTSIREAGDGLEALALIDAEVPDVLITDLSMPKLDGLGLIDQLASRGLTIPTIVLTAHQDTEPQDEGGASARYRVLHKPLRLPQLTEALAEVAAELGLVAL